MSGHFFESCVQLVSLIGSFVDKTTETQEGYKTCDFVTGMIKCRKLTIRKEKVGSKFQRTSIQQRVCGI